MAEVDPVVLELRAEMGRYRAELKNATALSTNSFNRIDRDVRQLEQQFARSSGAIGNSLKGLAGTFAAAFSAREVVNLVDGYTRLQNSLKVAGLEGENLAEVQTRLLELSGRYGVSIESLAGLFGNASQAGRDLGASQDQLLGLTEATSQALLITGTSATQAAGAILGLQQALAGGTVRAEEFNQINEGGLRPLLQAAAASEQFGGSVSKLRAAVLEGQVSSQQFFAAILAGSAQLEGQASTATLTLSGAFESLTSQLTVYVGQAAETSGVTNALATALQTLANNLDIVIPAVAVLATALGVGLIVNLTKTAVAAGGAGTALLTAFGGPIGLAISALAVGIGFLATETAQLESESRALNATMDDLEAKLRAAGVEVKGTGSAADQALPSILNIGNAYKFASAQAAALARNAKLAALAQLQADRVRVQGKLTAADAGLATANRSNANPLVAGANALFGESQAVKQLRADRAALAAQEKRLSGLIGAVASAPTAAFAKPVEAARTSGGAPAAGRGATGRASAAQVESISKAEIAKASQGLRDVGATLADALQRVNDFTRNQFDLATAGNQNEQDLLRASLAMAVTRQERADLEARLIDLQFSQERAEQELVLATLGSSDTARKIATARLAVLDALQNQARQESSIANESPGQRFVREIGENGQRINEDFEGVAVDGLNALNNGLTDAIVNAKSLGDVFSGVAKQIVADLLRIAVQQAVIAPLAGALFGGGGGIGGALGSIFGRASGGPVSAGRLYRVNEASGRGNVELFQPSQNGNIVPLGQSRAAMAGGGGQPVSGTITLSLSGDLDSRIVSVSGPLAVQIVREASGPLIDASANEAVRRAGRPKI
jgi:tape measure domain-containing protein